MSEIRSHTHRHKKRRSLFSRILSRVKRIFRNLFVDTSPPKEFRPYLGPDASPEVVERSKFINTRADIKKYLKKSTIREKRHFRLFNMKKLNQKLEQARDERKKNLRKRQIKSRINKHERKKRRVEFIRKFFPNYKRKPEISIEYHPVESGEGKTRLKQSSNLTYTLNSALLFILAYLLVYMTYQLTVLVVAARWRLDSVLLYYDLAFNDYSPLWNRSNIIKVTFSGPFISLLIGLIFLFWLSKRQQGRKLLKLFMLWVGLHGLNLFLGAFASGVSFDEGFGYVAAWLYMNIFWKIFLSLVFLFLLGWAGYSAASGFLDTSYSAARIKKENRMKFLLYQAFIPMVTGSLFLFLLRIPNNMPYDVGNQVTMFFAIVPMMFNRMAKPSLTFKIEKKQNQVNWLIIALAVVVLAAYRIGLNNGLHVELYYKFLFDLNITPL